MFHSAPLFLAQVQSQRRTPPKQQRVVHLDRLSMMQLQLHLHGDQSSGGAHGRPPKGRGLEKRASVSGPLFCRTPDVGAKGAGAQILARKVFCTKNFPPTNV